MERVTNRVFLLSPANIQVTAEDKAKIAEGGFFSELTALSIDLLTV